MSSKVIIHNNSIPSSNVQSCPHTCATRFNVLLNIQPACCTRIISRLGLHVEPQRATGRPKCFRETPP